MAYSSPYCFFKIGIIDNINIYYSCIGRTTDLTNINAIIEYISCAINPNHRWILIFDFKGMTAKHLIQIDLIKSLLKVFTKPEYRDYIQRFIGINMSHTSQKLLNIILPMLPGNPSSGIDTCGSSPLDILACMQRAKLNTDSIRWINKVAILELNERLPEILN